MRTGYRRAAQRPASGAALDPGHWLTGRLLHLIACREGTGPATEAVQGLALAPAGGAAWAPDGSGLVTAASQYWQAPGGGVDWALPCTLWWRGVLAAVPNVNSALLCRRVGSGADFSLDIQGAARSVAISWNGSLSFGNAAITVPAGVEVLLAVTLDAQAQTAYLASAAGLASAAFALGLTGSPGAAAPLTLGVDTFDPANRYIPGTTYQAGAAGGLLTADQVADLWADPWGMFAAPSWWTTAVDGVKSPAVRGRRSSYLRSGTRGVA